MDNSNTLKSMLIREFHSKFKVTKVYKYAKRGIRKKKKNAGMQDLASGQQWVR